MTAHWSDALVRLGACEEAVDWARTQPDLATAWRVCERADWLLWLTGSVCADGDDLHRAVVRAACACARTALRHVPDGETRPLRAIEAAEAWAAHPTPAARAAWAAARAAARAAASAAAWDAAWDARDAARAASAAWDAARAAARAAAMREMADLVRQHIPDPPEVAS